MYGFKEQVEFVTKLNLKDGEHKTLTCPSCGKYKKFTVDKFDGKLIWNCYSASCNVKGSYTGDRDINAIRNYLNGTPTQKAKRRLNKMPDITTRVENYAPAMEYLASVNSLEAYQNKLVTVKYAPTDKRVLFYTPDQLGAVGRALDKRNPKWWSYGDTSAGIPVGEGDQVVLVEDVPSACAVSCIKGYVGLALLGTSLTKPIRDTLSKYNNVTLVLDNDAASKAVYLTRKYVCIHRVRFTQKDLKWLTGEQIQKVLQ